MSKENESSFSLQSILDTHDKPFVLVDENYTIVGANEAYCDRYDTNPGKVLGSKCHMVHHNSESPCHTYGEECPMQRVMETGDRFEVSHVHHNHDLHPECVSIKGFPVTDTDGRRYLGEEITQSAATLDAEGNSLLQSIEARCIAELLVEHNGHRRKVAEILKISERTLYRKLVSYNLTNVGKKHSNGK